ncbi:hypothetical protein [Streptomyces lavendofoliae]|uniref:Uncharacterized protein n=1 Tax=Streptomyces lavendofoliae TaxID=67314 RepID=A0A918HUD9_9ACTN|nr:hypothetical protein [Streptomyces lavendofoliae]GGU29157.1 hypothetical protein GCM10010274_15020 [Streptomyces lavendofoliae]
MSTALRRTAAVLVLLAGTGLGFWVVFGPPHEWTGGMRLLKFALGMTSLGMISASAWLMFPGSPDDDDDAPSDPSSPTTTGPLDAL